MRASILWALLPLLVAATQQPGIEQSWRSLRSQLEATDSEPPTPNRIQRINLLAKFIERWNNDANAARPELIAARSRLGSLLLAGLDAAAAIGQFDAILSTAPDDALDARGRALYGKAQALILQGRDKRAQDTLDTLHRDFVGTRWASQARVALEHLAGDRPDQARVDKPAPEIGPRLDRLGKSRSLAELRGQPVLLLFLSPFDRAGLNTADRWIDRAKEAGLSSEQILSFLVGADSSDLDDLVKRRRSRGRLFATPAGFLDPVLLRYRVRSLPTAALIGPDGTLLAWDLPPARLQRALEKLLR